MEGKLSKEADDDDASTSPTRRRVLKASAALSATGVVGSGFVGQAAASDRENVECPHTVQCDGTVVFNSQEVGDCVRGTCGPDSVTIATVVVSCESGGWVDCHDKTTKTGPSGTFKAGYPVGASTLLQQGTHTNVEIPLLDCPPAPGGSACLEWDRCNWPNDQNPNGTRAMGAMLHLDSHSPGSITHYCDHGGGVENAEDPAYLCDRDNDGNREPVQTVRDVIGDGDDCGSCPTA